MATKKAAAAKKTTKKASSTEKSEAQAKREAAAERRQEQQERDLELQEQIKELRDQEDPPSWKEISDDLGVNQGKAMMLYMRASVRPKDRIKGDEETVAAAIVAARDDEQLSWGMIAARAGMAESRVRKIYRDTSGSSDKGNRIGKGGRWPEGMEPDEDSKPKKTTAKKTTAKKAATPKNILDMDEEEVEERLTGRTIQVSQNGKSSKIKVKSVTGVDPGEDGEVEFTDGSGNARTVNLSDIKRISK